MLKNKYHINGISVEPNYGEKWTYDAPKEHGDFIMLDNVDTDSCLNIDLIQAKFIRDSLDEIITYYENIPKIGDFVGVISGIFAGYFGTIMDIDPCDSKRPLVVKLDDNPDFNNCTCFVNFEDIKKGIDKK